MTATSPTDVHYDPYDVDIDDDPYPTWTRLRDEAPLYRNDELGFYAAEHPHYVTDIHATALHQLGLDPLALEVPGRRRLEIDLGHPIKEILA